MTLPTMRLPSTTRTSRMAPASFQPRVQMAKRVMTLAMPSFTPGTAMGRGI